MNVRTEFVVVEPFLTEAKILIRFNGVAQSAHAQRLLLNAPKDHNVFVFHRVTTYFRYSNQPGTNKINIAEFAKIGNVRIFAFKALVMLFVFLQAKRDAVLLNSKGMNMLMKTNVKFYAIEIANANL